MFSGIGGMSIGLERAGAETIAFCEIDDYASRVLEKQWPKVPNIRGGVMALNALLKKAQTASPQGSPVRTYPSLAKAPDLPEPVRDSSGLSFVPFAWFDQRARCWRTWQRCLVEGWEIFSGTWPRSGMMRNGIAYQRAPLVLLTRGTASGFLLPTPEASNTKAIALRSAGRSPRSFLAPLPTPTAKLGDPKRGMPSPELAAKRWAQGRRNLEDAVAMWPTPTSRDWKSSSMGKQGNARPLSEVAGNGPLNPKWVEWLMGFPIGWTDLDASATRLSRKSSKRSAAR